MMREGVTEATLPGPHGYLTYYKLLDAPFRTTADSRRLWLGGSHRALLDTLTAAIRQGEGIILLTGDAGTGKTSLVNWVIDMLDREALVIGRLPPWVFEVSELSQAVADAFGLGGKFPSAAAFATRFREFLATTQSRGSKVLLVIDEAQGLGDELFRKVFDLSTVGAFEEHPFAILLAGQRELSAALSKDQHAGLRQRITTTCVLEPLTTDEVGEYIRSRLHTAGSEEAIFAPDAVRQIASVSRGAPGLINVVCERALLAGYQRQARPIGPEIIDASLGGMGLGERWSARDQVAQASEAPWAPVFARRRSARLGATLTIILLVLAILGVGGYALYVGRFGRPAGHPVQSSTGMPAVDRRGQDGQGDVVRVPAAAKQASPDKAEPSALAPSVDGGPTLPPATGDRERVRSAPAKVQSPVAAGRARPQDTTPRERTRVPAPERQRDTDDPGAIIDWLMRESERR